MRSKFQEIVNAGVRIGERSDARTRLGNDIEAKDLFYTMMNTADPKTGLRFTQKDLWNEDYFPSPDEYRPDRWIVNPEMGVSEESIKIANQAFCPFSIGARSCVGWKLAWTELNVTIARALFRYDMRLAPDSRCCGGERDDCDFRLKGWVTSAVEGPWVQLRPRT